MFPRVLSELDFEEISQPKFEFPPLQRDLYRLLIATSKDHLSTKNAFLLKLTSIQIVLLAFSGSIKNIFLIDFVNIYPFSIFFSIVFQYVLPGGKSVGLFHIIYTVIYQL